MLNIDLIKMMITPLTKILDLRTHLILKIEELISEVVAITALNNLYQIVEEQIMKMILMIQCQHIKIYSKQA